MVVLTICGAPASGKSTVARMLHARLGWPFFSMGTIRREYAIKHGMSLDELNAQAKTDPASDRLVDEYQKELPTEHENLIVESRLGWYFIPQSIKVYIDCDPREGAQRIYKEQRPEERWASVEEGIKRIKARQASDRARYEKLYGIDHTDLSHFDLVIDSTGGNPLKTMHEILDYLRERGIEG